MSASIEMLLAANDFAVEERGLAVPDLHQHSYVAALSVSGEILEERLPAALDSLARDVVGRRFSDRDRGSIQSLFHRSVSRAGSGVSVLARARAWRALFGAGHLNAATSEERLAREDTWTTDELNSAFAMGWTPEATVLVLAGHREPLEVEALVRQRFETWRRGPVASEREEITKAGGRRPIYVVNAPSAQVDVVVAAEGPVDAFEDEVPFEILTLLLNGPSSRIGRVLGQEFGLTYGVQASYEFESSVWLLQTAIDPLRVHDTVDAILTELDRLQKDPVFASELEGARVEYLERFAKVFRNRPLSRDRARGIVRARPRTETLANRGRRCAKNGTQRHRTGRSALLG